MGFAVRDVVGHEAAGDLDGVVDRFQPHAVPAEAPCGVDPRQKRGQRREPALCTVGDVAGEFQDRGDLLVRQRLLTLLPRSGVASRTTETSHDVDAAGDAR